jgi:hypothetical protein
MIGSHLVGASGKVFATSSGSSGSGLAVSVSGNTLINAAYGSSGSQIQLRGADMSALEFVGVQGFSNVNEWGGVEPAWGVYQTWKPNCIRMPLNVASWLGLTCQTADANPATSFSGTNVLADPQGDYKQTVIDGIAQAQQVGCYVILDLHWSAPQVTLGGSTQYILANGQPEFANSSTDITFWTSIANYFGTQATPQTSSTTAATALSSGTVYTILTPGSTNWTAVGAANNNAGTVFTATGAGTGSGVANYGSISNAGILFELFNEPYMDDYASGSTLYGLMLNGGTVATYHWAIGAYSVAPTGGVGIAGYQQMLNAIRTTGAQNVIIANGPSFTQSIENYAQYTPTDTLGTPQVCVGWHPYPNGTYNYSNGDVYGKIGADSGGGTYLSTQWAQAVLTAGLPVIITEDGGQGGSGSNSGEPHMSFMQHWADAFGAHYIAWQWNNPQSSSSTTNNYMTTGTQAAPTPILGEGQEMYNWLTAHQTGPARYVRQSAQFQNTAHNSVNSSTWNATFSKSVLAGSTIYVVGMWPNFASTYPSMGCTDSGGANVYTQLDRIDDLVSKNNGIQGTQSMGHWYRANVAAGSYTINMAPSSPTSEDWVSFTIFEVAYLNAPTSPVVGHAISISSSVAPGTNVVSLGISPSAAGLMISVTFDDVSYAPTTVPLPGAPQAIATTAASGTGTTATVTFGGGLTVPVGATVIIAGVTPAGYNGTYTVTASSAGSVSFASTTTGSQSVAGTIFPMVNDSLSGASFDLGSMWLFNTNGNNYSARGQCSYVSSGAQLVTWSPQEPATGGQTPDYLTTVAVFN